MKEGRFEGLTEKEWEEMQKYLPKEPEKRKQGMPHAPFKKVWNTIIYVLKNGSRWCDVPKGEQWGSKSAAHRWLKRWQEEGVLTRSLTEVIERAGQDVGK